MTDINLDLTKVFEEGSEANFSETLTEFNLAKPESTTRDDLLAGQTVVLTGNDKDLTSYAAARASTDKQLSMDEAVAQMRQQLISNAEQLVAGTLQSDPDSLPQAVETANQQLQGVSSREISVFSAEEEVVGSIASISPVDVSDKIKKEAAFRLAAMNDIALIMQKQGTLDKVADFAGMWVPFNLTADLSDVLDTKFDWTNATDVGQFVLDWKALPTERKVEYWPQVVRSIMDATGTTVAGVDVSDKNVLKAAGILTNLLNPTGAQELSFERTLDIVLGAADVLPAGLLGSAFLKLKKSNNLVKTTNEMGDGQRAAQMNMAAISDEDAASALGLSRQEAATNALPMEQSALHPEHTKGLSKEMSKSLNDFQREAQGLTRTLQEEGLLIKEGLLRKSEKQRVIQDRITELQKIGEGEDVLNEGIHFQNFKARNITEEGAEIVYESVKNGDITTVVEPVKWTRDNVSGMFVETTEKALPGFEYGASNAAWAHTGPDGDFLASFKSASNIADLAAAAQSQMLDLVNAANKPVSGVLGVAARKRLSLAEIAGDEFLHGATGTRGKVWTPEELSSNFSITAPAEVETYYRRRVVADQFFLLENHAARRQLELLGFDGEVVLNGDKAISKTLDSVQSARSTIANKTGAAAYDANKADSVPLTGDMLDEIYEQGNVLVRLADDTPVRHADNSVEHFDFAIVPRSEIGAMPDRVIHYKPGYVPKINKGVEYLVKEAIPGIKKGSPDFTRAVTHRFFASKEDAIKYRDEMRAKFLRENEGATEEMASKRFEWVADRELTPLQKLQEGRGSSGGLYTGARSSEDIVSGLSGVKTERLSPFDAFNRNAQHLGSLITRNEWRVGEEQRWLNTIESYGFTNNGFNGTTFDTTTNIGKALEHERQLIKMWNGIPTQEENVLQSSLQSLHDWMLNGVRKVPGLSTKESIPSLLWLKHSNPSAAFKTAAFHATLGVLNPAQLFVQASAATVAIGRFPTTAPRALAYATKLGYTDLVRNQNALTRVAKGLEKVDDNTPLFNEVRAAWERSGLRESVRQNADLTAVDSYGVLSMGAMKRIGDANLFFYRNGELLNRRMSFVSSYLDWKKRNPGKLPTNDDLRSIKADANLSMLELNHANRAMWQGGPQTGVVRNILGNMFQFQQVGAKAMELLVKGKARGGFTPAEKARILAAQFAFYGAAGVPLMNAVVGEATDWLDAEMSEDAKNAWNQGIAGILIANTFESEVSVGPRLAPFGQTAQFVRDLLFDDAPFLEKVAGVAGDVGGRAGKAFKILKPMMMAGLEGQELSKEDLLLAMSVIGEIPSSSRSLVKAWIMNNEHKIRDRHGNTIVFDDFNWQTEVGVALGFRPTQEIETRIVQMSNRDYDQLVSDYSETLFAMTLSYIRTAETDGSAAIKLEKAKQILFESLDNPMLKQRVVTSVMNKIMDGTSLEEKEIKKFMELQANELNEASTVLRRGFFANTLNENAVVQPFGGKE